MMMMVYFSIYFFAEQGSWRADGAVREAFFKKQDTGNVLGRI